MEYKRVQPVRLGDQILAQIRARLSTRELAPGDKLPSEREFAEQLGVSRNAVREALRVLEASGVINIQKGHTGGAFVGQGDSGILARGLGDLMHLRGGSLEQITEARFWIEGIVVKVACERRSEEDLARLEENLLAGEAAVARGESDRTLGIAIDFHIILAEATKNTLLILVMQTITAVISDLGRKYGIRSNETSLRGRRTVFDFVREQNAEAAADAMARYLQEVHERYRYAAAAGDGAGPERGQPGT